jgi:hypothetical protein
MIGKALALKGTVAAAAVSAALLGGLGTTSAEASIPNVYHVVTPWQSYDGGCQAQAELYYYPASNTAQLRTNVYDPYWFAACRVVTKVDFDTNFTVISDGPSQPAMACAVFDPSCASTTYGPWQPFSPASATLQNLKGFGLDLSQLVNDARISFSKG